MKHVYFIYVKISPIGLERCSSNLETQTCQQTVQLTPFVQCGNFCGWIFFVHLQMLKQNSFDQIYNLNCIYKRRCLFVIVTKTKLKRNKIGRNMHSISNILRFLCMAICNLHDIVSNVHILAFVIWRKCDAVSREATFIFFFYRKNKWKKAFKFNCVNDITFKTVIIGVAWSCIILLFMERIFIFK